MRQMPFGWPEKDAVEARDEIVLEPKTMEIVIALMATALIAVVRGPERAEGPADDR